MIGSAMLVPFSYFSYTIVSLAIRGPVWESDSEHDGMDNGGDEPFLLLLKMKTRQAKMLDG
jgi:hypothetical protein